MKHPPRDALGAQAHRWHRHRPVPPAVRVRPQLFPISLPPPARAAGPRDPFSTRPHVLHQAPIWSGPAARFSFRPVTCFHPAPNPSPSIHSSSCLWMGSPARPLLLLSPFGPSHPSTKPQKPSGFPSCQPYNSSAHPGEVIVSLRATGAMLWDRVLVSPSGLGDSTGAPKRAPVVVGCSP